MSSRSARPKRALVLGGGGVLGFAWTLGALSALESVAQFDVRDVDLVLGTSAGSVAAGLLGCGVPLEAICRHHQGMPAPADPPIAYDYEAATNAALPPRPAWRLGSPRLLLDGLRHPRRLSPIVTLTGLLPTGRGTLQPVRELMSNVARESGFADTWPTRPRPWVVAADYRTGRRIIFGRDDFAPRAVSTADGRSRNRVKPAEPDVSAPPRVIRRANLPDAVTASCSIPAWYPPTVIDGIPYIDGGAVSNASVDALRGTGVEEAYVLAPMASVQSDRARSAVGRVERVVRRAITRGILTDVVALRATGVRVHLVTPEPADLAVLGVNLMNPSRRTEVLETAQVTAAEQLARQLAMPTGRGGGRGTRDASGQAQA